MIIRWRIVAATSPQSSAGLRSVSSSSAGALRDLHSKRLCGDSAQDAPPRWPQVRVRNMRAEASPKAVLMQLQVAPVDMWVGDIRARVQPLRGAALLAAATAACLAVCGPAKSEVTLDSYVTSLEDTPIHMNGGKKHAMNEAERMLLMQQDELRKLRSSSEAANAPSAYGRLSAPQLPSAPSTQSLQTPTASAAMGVSIAKGGVLLQSEKQAEGSVATGAAAQQGESGGAGGLLNIGGVLLAGVLGGLLYQSNQGQKRVKDDMESKVAEKQKEADRLKGAVKEAEGEIEAREKSEARMQDLLEEERSTAAQEARAMRSAAALADDVAAQARQDAAGTVKLNEALQVEVRWADELRGKEKQRRAQAEEERSAVQKAKATVESHALQLTQDLGASQQRGAKLKGSLMSATERAEGLAEGLQQEREQSAALHSGLTREQARTHDLQERLADEMERSEAFETDLQKSAARAGELQSSMQTGLETANELGTSLKGQLQEAERDCTALQAALREEEVETDTLRGSLAEQQAQAASLEEHLNSTEEQLSKETTVREQREAQLEVTQQALAAEQEAAAAAVEASTNSLKNLKEEMQATEAGLREAAGQNALLLAQADEVKRQYLLAQDSVEEEQSVVMRMRREIGKLDGKLKTAEIDNQFLRTENTQIRGDIGSLSEELDSTRKSLLGAREDAVAQRAQSEQTLAQLQTALDRIQVQVEAVVVADRTLATSTPPQATPSTPTITNSPPSTPPSTTPVPVTIPTTPTTVVPTNGSASPTHTPPSTTRISSPPAPSTPPSATPTPTAQKTPVATNLAATARTAPERAAPPPQATMKLPATPVSASSTTTPAPSSSVAELNTTQPSTNTPTAAAAAVASNGNSQRPPSGSQPPPQRRLKGVGHRTAPGLAPRSNGSTALNTTQMSVPRASGLREKAQTSSAAAVASNGNSQSFPAATYQQRGVVTGANDTPRPGSVAPVRQGRGWGNSSTLNITTSQTEENILPTIWKHTDISEQTAAKFTRGNNNTAGVPAAPAAAQQREQAQQDIVPPAPVVDSAHMSFDSPNQLTHAHSSSTSESDESPAADMRAVAKPAAQKMSVWEEAAVNGGGHLRGHQVPPSQQRRGQN